MYISYINLINNTKRTAITQYLLLTPLLHKNLNMRKIQPSTQNSNIKNYIGIQLMFHLFVYLLYYDYT